MCAEIIRWWYLDFGRNSNSHCHNFYCRIWLFLKKEIQIACNCMKKVCWKKAYSVVGAKAGCTSCSINLTLLQKAKRRRQLVVLMPRHGLVMMCSAMHHRCQQVGAVTRCRSSPARPVAVLRILLHRLSPLPPIHISAAVQWQRYQILTIHNRIGIGPTELLWLAAAEHAVEIATKQQSHGHIVYCGLSF